MSRGQFIVLILAAVMVGGALGGLTAPASTNASKATAPSRELVVFETDNCVYCRLFRRDVLPAHERSGAADELPIRFVKVSDAGALTGVLTAPLTVVPTAVLLVDGREAGRISGYTGPAAFHQLVSHMLAAN